MGVASDVERPRSARAIIIGVANSLKAWPANQQSA